MKKYFTLTIAALLTAGAAYSQSATLVTKGDIWMLTGGEFPFAISDNGRYIGGMALSLQGFVYDTESGYTALTPEDYIINPSGSTNVVAVDNNGVGYGADPENGAFSLNIDGQYGLVHGIGDGIVLASVRDCTPDGSLLVGYYSRDWQNNFPCVWKDGKVITLPTPNPMTVDFIIAYGTRALRVSADGSLILGEVLLPGVENSTMVLWKLQDDGSYKLINAYEDYFDGIYFNHYDDNGKVIWVERGDMPYSQFKPKSMTSDGKTVLMELRGNTTDVFPPLRMGLYDVETKKLTEIEYTEDNLLYSRGYFTLNDIADDGTVIGMIGQVIDNPQPVILYANDYYHALTATEAFPGVPLLEELETNTIELQDEFSFIAITPDASRIVGYAVIETDVVPGYWSWAVFYIDTNRSGVESVETDSTASRTVEYYTLDGIRVERPVKGINIVRDSEGKTHKIVVK